MILLLVFLAFFAFGWWRAAKRGGGIADKLRYGFIHGLAAALVVYTVATLGDWQGVFN
ncbi:MAG: hypothetical protein ACQEUZ_16865 [Pseudomonadota bacterium]